MNFQFTLALRYLMGRKQRTLLTTLAVMIGVMLIFGLNGVIPALMGMLRQNLMASANHADLTITSEARGVFDARRAAQVREVDGVASAAGALVRSLVLSGELSLVGRDGVKIDTVIVTGVDVGAGGQALPLAAGGGRNLQPGDGDVLVIPAILAEKTGLVPGSLLNLPTADGVRAFQVVGVAADRPTLRAEPVYMPLAAAQALFNLRGQINTIDVVLEDGVDRQAATAAVLARLGAGFKVGENEAGSELITAIEAGRFIFNVFGALALVMGGFIIFNTFRTIVVERRRDIGMLRAIGATRGMVLSLVLTESLIQGLTGTLLGLLGGYGLIRLLLWFIRPTVQTLMRMDIGVPDFSAQTILSAVGMGLGVTLLSGLSPALAASRLSPLEAMRPAAAEQGWRLMTRRLGMAGLLAACAVVGLASGNPTLGGLGMLVFVGALITAAPALVYPISRVFGRLLELVFVREGSMAEGNLARQPVRAAVTVSAVMIGLAVFLGMAGTVSSLRNGIDSILEHSFNSDYLLMPQSLVLGGGNIGAGPELIQQVRQIGGVDGATSLRLSTARLETADIQVIGIDPPEFARISGLDISQGDAGAAYAGLAGGREMIINSILAGQSRLTPGDTTILETAEGPQAYRVAAVGNDLINAKLATAYISQANLQADFHETTDLLIMVKGAVGADRQAVMAALDEAASAYPAFAVFDTRVWRAEFTNDVYHALNMFLVLLVALAVPSLLALMNTLGINVLERTREIGTLRAVGATRRQVRRLILAESLLLAATGSAFGILAGLWLGYLLVLTMQVNGFDVVYFFPLSGLLVTVAVGLLLGVAAAWLPARSAARMDVVEALRYE